MDIDLPVIAKIASIVGNVCILIGLIVALWQLFLTKKRFFADHERAQKQATIDFWHDINSTGDRLFKKIDKQFSNSPILNVCDAAEESPMRETIKEFLNHMEQISVGINTGVYSIAVFDRLAGAYTIRCYDRLAEIISNFGI